jgi:hypothetical protein
MTDLLPSPLAMTALGTALVVAAGLLLWFAMATMLKLALILGGIGGALLLAASVAYGYELKGEEKLRPRLDAAEAAVERQRVYANQLTANWRASQEKSAKLAAAMKARDDENAKLRAQQIAQLPKAVVDLPFPAAAVRVLNAAARASANTGSEAQADAASVAAPDSGAARGNSTVGAVTAVCSEWADAFKVARDQVIGWNNYFDSLWDDAQPGP